MGTITKMEECNGHDAQFTCIVRLAIYHGTIAHLVGIRAPTGHLTDRRPVAVWGLLIASVAGLSCASVTGGGCVHQREIYFPRRMDSSQ